MKFLIKLSDMQCFQYRIFFFQNAVPTYIDNIITLIIIYIYKYILHPAAIIYPVLLFSSYIGHIFSNPFIYNLHAKKNLKKNTQKSIQKVSPFRTSVNMP